MISFLATLLLLAQVPAAPQTAPQQPPSANTSPAKPQNASPLAIPPPPDPASTQFLTDVGIVLVAIKPAAVADYELAIRSLQEALSKVTDKEQAAAAKGWRVLKSSDADGKGNQLYVHLMMPAIAGFDYRPSLLLDELVKEITPELLSKYQGAFAMPPTRLNLTEFALMSVAPLPETPPPAVKKPGGR